jgi:hypothetical protein
MLKNNLRASLKTTKMISGIPLNMRLLAFYKINKWFLEMPIKYIFLLLLINLAACENEHVVEVGSTYIEYTVVQSELRTDEYFPGVRFTKTLPLGISYDINKAEIKNITAYLRINNAQIVPIYYTHDGLYKSIYQWRIKEGDTYELLAKRNETFIYGKTYIPQTPTVTQANLNLNSHSLEGDVLSFENEVYAAIWKISTNIEIRAEDFFSVSVPEVINPNSTVPVRTSSIPEIYMDPVYNESRYIQVYSFDKAFKAYFNSRTSGQGIDDPFIQGGGSIEWNVKGDKVIGMFIGVGKGEPVLIQ